MGMGGYKRNRRHVKIRIGEWLIRYHFIWLFPLPLSFGSEGYGYLRCNRSFDGKPKRKSNLNEKKVATDLSFRKKEQNILKRHTALLNDDETLAERSYLD